MFLHSKTNENSLAWLRVFCLATAGFIFTTSEFSPVGLLSDIGLSFQLSSAQTGLLLTVYAWIVALASLPITICFAKMNRRPLLGIVFILFITGQIGSAVAPTFLFLMAARIVVAFAHAIFWSITAAIVLRLAPLTQQNKALGFLISGNMLATIAGLPLGRLIGQYFGWRLTFGLIGFIAFLVILLLWRVLPSLSSKNAGSLRSLPGLLTRGPLLCFYLQVLIMISAHFSVYSYIEPFVIQVAGLGNTFATWVLFLFGSAGLISSLVFSHLFQKFPKYSLYAALTGLCCCLFAISFVRTHLSVGITCLCWGFCFILMNLSVQIRILRIASDATDIAMSMLSGIFNLGIGSGALLGGQIIRHSHMRDIPDAGIMLAIIGLCWCLIFTCYFQAKKQLGPDLLPPGQNRT